MQVGTQEVQEAVSEWFTQALGLKCWLVQQQAGSRQTADREQLAAGVPSPAASSLPASSEASLEPLEALQTRSIGKTRQWPAADTPLILWLWQCRPVCPQAGRHMLPEEYHTLPYVCITTLG